jgi:hypothetical protein
MMNSIIIIIIIIAKNVNTEIGCAVFFPQLYSQRFIGDHTVFTRVICAPAYFAHPNF